MRMKRIISFFALMLSFILMTSCGTIKDNTRSYSAPKKVVNVKSGAVANNDVYDLLWDNDKTCIILHNRITDEIRSSIPYDYYKVGDYSDEYKVLNFCSPLMLTCMNKDTSTSNIYYFDSSSGDNSVYSVRIKNGIRVVYIFSDIKVTIPVDYLLTSDGIEIHVLIDNITEKSELVYEVSVAPFFSSVDNNDSSYLFVPSGCGAIIRTDEKRQQRSYSEPVYGSDQTSQSLQEPKSTQQVCLPVYGTCSQSGGVFAIINKGAELGVINATAGDAKLGQSTAYATFRIRSVATSIMKKSNNTNTVVNKISESKADIEYASIKYALLDKNSCDYNAMAEYYRNYLKHEKMLDNKAKKGGIFLDIIGGVQVKKSFIGIPYNTVLAATTMEDTLSILKSLRKDTSSNIVVKLNGFNAGGIDGGKLAGGYKIENATGSKKKLETLNRYCEKNNISLLMNFDIISFSKTSLDFSMNFDSAKNANRIAAEQNEYSIVTHENNNGGKNRFLARSELTKASSKLLKAVEKLSVSGISLDSLGSVCYADCEGNKYIAKNKMPEDAAKIFESVRKSGLLTSTSAANLYASNVDYIFSMPSSTSKYLYFDAEIPFYQMIFHKTVCYGCESLNLVGDKSTTLVKAALCGASLQYSVCKSYYDEFISTKNSGLAASDFKMVVSDIRKIEKLFSPLWEATEGSEMISYKSEDNIGHTVFSNGTEIFGNLSAEDKGINGNHLGAYEFIVLKGNR